MEVDDRHNDKLIDEDAMGTHAKYYVPSGDNWSQNAAPNVNPVHSYQESGDTRRKAGPSKTTLYLAVALALALVLAAVAAGVAGSIAAQRQRNLQSMLARLKPQSECRNLTSPFSTFKPGQYELHCGIDLPTTGIDSVDPLGLYVYTMSDCINACSYWNANGAYAESVKMRCVAVTFNVPLGPDKGNCWLKGAKGIPFVQTEDMDSAILLVSP
ncbi:MAG: hypothetical protein Q9169_004208 [Polycauliona sp. 2 TL-2023]